MKQRIISGWNFVRVLWLMMGIGILIQAITEKNLMLLLPGLYFVFASVANIGCFAGNCATSYSANPNHKKEVVTEIELEEVQSKK